MTDFIEPLEPRLLFTNAVLVEMRQVIHADRQRIHYDRTELHSTALLDVRAARGVTKEDRRRILLDQQQLARDSSLAPGNVPGDQIQLQKDEQAFRQDVLNAQQTAIADRGRILAQLQTDGGILLHDRIALFQELKTGI
ncbi:MAG TPA: hypothetical protein VFW23_10705 [Tepidisphaeraceae bacterium]|nr:hypothetical protein [Tepidisphaeraceae bacterium]